jgi:hypothetical protein
MNATVEQHPAVSSAAAPRAGQPGRLVLLAWLFVLVALGLVAYGPGLAGKRFSDDYFLVFNPLPENAFKFFAERNPQHPFAYRPLEAAVMILMQQAFGSDTVPVHVTQLLLHALLAWLVSLWLLQHGGSRLTAALGGLFLLLAPVNVYAVASLDTFSQIGSGLFGCGSLWALEKFLQRPTPAPEARSDRGWGLLGLSVVLFALALLSKENSVTFLLPIGLVALLHAFESGRWARSLVRAAVVTLPFAVVLGAYFIVRGHVVGAPGPSFHEGRLGMHVGPGNAVNLAQLLMGALLPVSTVDVFTALKQRDFLALGLLGGAGALLGGLVLYGLWRSRRRGFISVLAACCVLVWLPMTLFHHVSELYTYSAMPLFAALVGLGLGGAFERARGRGLATVALTIVSLGLGLAQVQATRAKAGMIAANGERMEQLIAQILPHVGRVPEGGQLVLLIEQPDELDYSIFRMGGFKVFECGAESINRVTGRYDFEVLAAEAAYLKKKQKLRPDAVVLTLRDGKVAPREPAP